MAKKKTKKAGKKHLSSRSKTSARSKKTIKKKHKKAVQKPSARKSTRVSQKSTRASQKLVRKVRAKISKQSLTLQGPSKAKIKITPEIRRLWVKIRHAWVVSYYAFNHAIDMLDKRQANLMYDVVKHSLFKNSHAEILREYPELKVLIHTDDDRLCMHDIYERLSYRLNRYEKPPFYKRALRGMKGRIGRNLPDLGL